MASLNPELAKGDYIFCLADSIVSDMNWTSRKFIVEGITANIEGMSFRAREYTIRDTSQDVNCAGGGVFRFDELNGEHRCRGGYTIKFVDVESLTEEDWFLHSLSGDWNHVIKNTMEES